MAGMEYATRGFISQHCVSVLFGLRDFNWLMLSKVYFGMAGGELLIKAKEKESHVVLHLIPPRKLASDLPRVLIEKHVHWLNLSTGSIEIRPLPSLWQSSEVNWCIQFALRSMTKGRSVLFDIRSPTWKMLSDRLMPLQDPQDLLITRDSLSSTVSVHLPRYGLSFFINSDQELESGYPRGMVYDKNQYIGTLFGLVNKLVLRPKDNPAEGLVQRQVLIPEGKIEYRMHGHHVKVVVDVKGPVDRCISYKTFRIDTDLGGLVGNSGLVDNLYRAYLHALCSNPCAVDPLTGKTGTEEALSILRSGAVRSFLKFDGRAAKLLGRIASLTTERVWYPKHLKCMQTVNWAALPCASQHHNLYLACVSIKEFQNTLLDFHEGQFSSAFEGFPSRDKHLLGRIGLRAALIDPSGHGDTPNGDHDAIYAARDLLATSNEARAYSIGRAIFDWSSSSWMPRVTNIYKFLESPGQLEGASARTVSLRYNREWLFRDVQPIWLPLYNTCRSTQYGQHRFQLLFTLAAMTYASPDFEKVVLTLLAFATISQFKNESPPSYATYYLSNGYEPSWSGLTSCVRSNAVGYWASPEGSPQDYGQRLERDRGTLWNQTKARWPCRSLPSFYFLNPSLYNLGALESDVSRALESWYQNWELKQHLDRVQQILDQGYTAFVEPSVYSFAPSSPGLHPPTRHLTLEYLFHRQPLIAPSTLHYVAGSTGSFSTDSDELSRLIDNFRRHGRNPFHAKYANDLHLSKKHLVHDRINLSSESLARPVDQFEAHYNNCRSTYHQYLAVLAEIFAPQTRSERAVSESGQWPRVTIKNLFCCLASNSGVSVPSGWRHYLTSFAKLALEYQRSRRLLLLATNNQQEDLRKEMENPGCIGWGAESHPDWILLQVGAL